MSSFETKDSGKREQFSSGMVRDTTEGKSDPSLVLDGPMFTRWVALLDRGAQKYAKRNWTKASGEAEYNRFRESAFRHFLQWMNDERDEDHAAAVIFNINGAEYVREKLELGNIKGLMKQEVEDGLKPSTNSTKMFHTPSRLVLAPDGNGYVYENDEGDGKSSLLPITPTTPKFKYRDNVNDKRAIGGRHMKVHYYSDVEGSNEVMCEDVFTGACEYIAEDNLEKIN